MPILYLVCACNIWTVNGVDRGSRLYSTIDNTRISIIPELVMSLSCDCMTILVSSIAVDGGCGRGWTLYPPFSCSGYCLAYSVLRSYGWLNSVSREGSVGFISIFIQDSIKLGIALFMLSEVLFFIAFFWI